MNVAMWSGESNTEDARKRSILSKWKGIAIIYCRQVIIQYVN